MSKQNGGIYKSSVAKTVPADGSNCDLVPDKTNTQEYLDALCVEAGLSASTSYVFGREGAHNNNTWLIAAETVTNKRGLPFGINNGEMRKITIATQNIPSAFSIELWYHDGNLSGATLIGSVTTAGISATEDFLVSFAVPKGHQLACKVKTVGATKPKETGVVVMIKGDLS